MKTKYFLILILIIFLTSFHTSTSQILFTENFSYPAGDSIGAHGWIWNTGTSNTIFVTAPGLTYSGYPLSGVGNACRLRNNGNDAYKQMNSADSIGSIYLSFMVKVDSVRTLGDYFLALISPTSTTNYTARFYAKDSLGGLAFGVSKGSPTGNPPNPLSYTGGSYSLGTTYLIVIKYTFNPGLADDVINVYVFSSGIPATEPATPTIGPITGPVNDAAIGRVALRQGSTASSPTLNIDGIQVAKIWAKVVSIKNINSIAESFSLSQNYPNPFNPTTKIDFTIPQNGFVNLSVFNMIGKEMKNLIGKDLSMGSYSYEFDGSELNSGVYLYRIDFTSREGLQFTDSKKLILIK